MSAKADRHRATLADCEKRSGCGVQMTLQGIDALIQLVRQQINTEGLRPLANRTGIPVGQLRSFVQGRASRHTTLQSIATAMGMQLSIAQVEQLGMEAPLPRALTRALGLPPDASVAEAINEIDRDTAGSRLRRAMHLMEEMTEGASALAELLPQVGEPPIRMIPFTEQVGFSAETGELEFRKSSEVWVSVAERLLPSWARTARLTCIRMAGDWMKSTDAALVVVDTNRRAAVDGQLFVVLVVDALAVKRFGQVGDQWNLVSDGSAHPPRPLRADDRIVGRVAWRAPSLVAVR